MLGSSFGCRVSESTLLGNQGLDARAMYDSCMHFDTLSRQLLLNTCRVQATENGAVSTGTAFFWDDSDDSESSVPFVVTARHVVENADTIVTWVLKEDSHGDPLLGQAVRVNLPKPQDWTFHPDSEVDIAVVPFAPAVQVLRRRGITLAVKYVGRSFIIPSDELDDYDAVESISFVGYPNGLYDSASDLPVIRRGVTASLLHLHWNGRPQFLVDASVFPGSSGSPVFALSEGTYRTRLAVNVGTRCAFLGLLSATNIQMDTTGELRTASPKVVTWQLLDLGVVQRWTAVQETVAAALSRAELPTYPSI